MDALAFTLGRFNARTPLAVHSRDRTRGMLLYVLYEEPTISGFLPGALSNIDVHVYRYQAGLFRKLCGSGGPRISEPHFDNTNTNTSSTPGVDPRRYWIAVKHELQVLNCTVYIGKAPDHVFSFPQVLDSITEPRIGCQGEDSQSTPP